MNDRACLLRLLVAFGLWISSWPAAAAPQQDALRQSIPAPLGAAQSNAALGQSVAIDGTLTVVGAPGVDQGALDSGVAKVFDATTGELRYLLNHPSPVEGDRFGSAVAISGNRVAVALGAASGKRQV